MGAGFMLSHIDDDTDDDPDRIEAMLKSAENVLGRKIEM